MENSNLQNLNEELLSSAEHLNGKFNTLYTVSLPLSVFFYPGHEILPDCYISGRYLPSFEANENSKVFDKPPSEKPCRETLTKACSVRLLPLDIDVKSILNMEDRGQSPTSGRETADQQKRDSESFADGPVTKKHKNEDIIFLEADNKTLDRNTKPASQDVTVIKVKSGIQSKETAGGGGGQKEKEKKAPVDLSPESKSKAPSLQRTGSFDSSRKVEKEQKMSKVSPSLNSSSSSSSSTCTLDKTDRTSLHCLEQKLKDLQKASAQTKTKHQSGEILSSKPKSLSPSGMKPSKDNHHRRKEDFITERKKCNSSPKKQLKKSNSLPQVKENKMGNLFCPTTDAKVTILPINKPKDLEHKPQSTSNSVTITKISSGDSLSVPSKDIKKVFSPKSKVSPESSRSKFPQKTFSKSDKHRDKSEKTHKEHKHRDKEHRSRESSRESREGKEHSKHNFCSKCNDQFSTKEAKKLHTCNSILDAHYLIDATDRQKTSPTSSVSNSETSSGSLSRSSSRSSSPGIPGGVSNKKHETPPKIKLSVKNDSSDISKMKISLKKEESDEKVKKLGSSGPKRDSPKEKWVESKNCFKSDQHLSERDRTSGITIEPVNNDDLLKQLGKNNGDCRKDGKEDLSLISNRVDHEFSFSGKRTYSPSMSENISVDGKGER